MDNRSEIIQSASAALQASDPERALLLARELLQGDPDNADGYLLLGIAHATLGNDPDAISALRNAVLCAPDSARARYNLATHLYRVGQKREAAEQVAAALASDPTHSASQQLLKLLESESVAPTMAETPPQVSSPPIVGEAFQFDSPSPTPRPSWIEGLGTTWPMVGWFLTLLGLALFIVTLVAVLPVAMESGGEVFSAKYFESIERAVPSWLQVLDLANRFLWIVWMSADLLGRRRSPWWYLGIIPCCCLNTHWLIGIAYLATGKIEKNR
ncbi:MAG: hypothetical protein HONBIEJF_00566 [Fimbriimonadaceae bacterium]|nr:hypothetical protein [Fimbriimonadaceae bacterium]